MAAQAGTGSFAAFLRGINVGGRRLKMDQLRERFEAMGFAGARTFIASGNVVFDAASDDPASLEGRIEDGLRETLGYEVDTFVRSADELRAIDRLDLFPEIDRTGEDRVHVLFLRTLPDRDAARRIAELLPEGDALRIEAREIYWLRRGRLAVASLATFERLQAAAGAAGTMRNLNTVKSLTAKFFG